MKAKDRKFAQGAIHESPLLMAVLIFLSLRCFAFSRLGAGSLLSGENHHDHSRQRAGRRRRDAHPGGGELSQKTCAGKSHGGDRVHGRRRWHQGRQSSLSRRARRWSYHRQRAERHGVVGAFGRSRGAVRSRQVHLSRLAEQRIPLRIFYQSKARFAAAWKNCAPTRDCASARKPSAIRFISPAVCSLTCSV